MFSKFRYDRIPLSLIKLDVRNPRIVTQSQLKSESDIVKYLFEHENLDGFLKKIVSDGRNPGAERPYVVKAAKEFVVLEGNTRIAAYKLLTGLLKAPEGYEGRVPHITPAMKEDLSSIDCSIAPSRDAVLPIMANSHFGMGDKSRWGYLGSRRAVFEEHNAGKSIAQLASAFDRKPAQIRDFLIEYQLYLEALKLSWTEAEKNELLRPEVEFNPPVRFLQTTSHKNLVGLEFDKVNLTIIFNDDEAKEKFRHLIKKLVIANERGLGATSTYGEVFADYNPPKTETSKAGTDATASSQKESIGPDSSKSSTPQTDGSTGGSDGSDGSTPTTKRGRHALFNYPVSGNNATLIQLMKEAKKLNTQNFPGAGTALLRAILEAILKTIIHDQKANTQDKLLSLETALDICLSNNVKLAGDDKRILKEFKRSHLDHVNMGSHAALVPNTLRLAAARDCVDQFVMRNI
ncbi:hypothetical protein ADU59_25470 [Pararhizobium polonicum]|uniref:ParB/Sulfiredoxin domain-containing protein n=1 Tax=Pararhizobium polonicum TaxID=1612624 RepID=A0A1C7NUN1_9HYPH|nr:hypothetical protein [Pararhizobium polonicum]OBZ92728.1 hypothetical protein ADU59_25470 [Pararhizobium polonicum]